MLSFNILFILAVGTMSCSPAMARQGQDTSAASSRFTESGPRIVAGNETTGYILREDRLIDGDEKRAYALIGPAGRRISRRRFFLQDGNIRTQPEIQSGTKEQNGLPVGSAGLLVVLPPGDGDLDAAVGFWSDVMQNALKGRYYVAIALQPHWDAPNPTPWLTEANVREVRGARFSTEAFAADIAHDVSLRYNIDPKRTFLHGAAESGLAVYACSLTDRTPFSGFYIHDSPFRTAKMPPFTHVRARRYFLQQSQDDKNGPLWMAEVARKLLTEKGAIVKLNSYHGAGPYKFTDSPFDHITEALTWLETGKAK